MRELRESRLFVVSNECEFIKRVSEQGPSLGPTEGGVKNARRQDEDEDEGKRQDGIRREALRWSKIK